MTDDDTRQQCEAFLRKMLNHVMFYDVDRLEAFAREQQAVGLERAAMIADGYSVAIARLCRAEAERLRKGEG